jgi:hypothetical protein
MEEEEMTLEQFNEIGWRPGMSVVYKTRNVDAPSGESVHRTFVSMVEFADETDPIKCCGIYGPRVKGARLWVHYSQILEVRYGFAYEHENKTQFRVKDRYTRMETLAWEFGGGIMDSTGEFYCPVWVENSYKEGEIRVVRGCEFEAANFRVKNGPNYEYDKVKIGSYLVKSDYLDSYFECVSKDVFERKYEILEEIEARSKNAEYQ